MFFDPLDLSLGFPNKHNVLFGDVFYLEYYGINVFLCVSQTGIYFACVYELATKKIKHNKEKVEVIKPNRKKNKKPLIFEGEKWLETGFEDGQKCLYVPIERTSPIYRKAIELGTEFPRLGTFKAIYLEEEIKNGLLNYYWHYKVKNNEKQQKNNKIKNNA